MPPIEAHPLLPSGSHQLAPVGDTSPAAVAAHASVEVGYCDGCHNEHNELLRDKRGELEIACPSWGPPPNDERILAFLQSLPADAPDYLQRLVATVVHQAGRDQDGCNCPHLLAAGTPHASADGKPWCPGGQHAHGPEHGPDLCFFPDYATYTFQRSGGHYPRCAADGCDLALRCLCATPEATHYCPEHVPAPEPVAEPLAEPEAAAA